MREWPQLDVVHERLPLDDDIAVAAVIAAVDAVIAVIDVAVIDAVVYFSFRSVNDKWYNPHTYKINNTSLNIGTQY